ncbi:thiamine phosphate synthase [Methanomicrobium mobile]|uniref:thiamine phosphate synthase n=1 Tax=Methanomicrobium mobile TaxID=2205 RepID=UPI0009FBEE83|nr:thiamine phosphate synthase [Methanomicrobium mobile]
MPSESNSHGNPHGNVHANSHANPHTNPHTNPNPYALYIVTDIKVSGGLSHERQAELCFAGGCDALQLREKDTGYEGLIATAKNIVALKQLFERENPNYHPLFFVNDNIDVAVKSGANGVHLGQDDMPLSEARRLMPKSTGFLIGISVGNVEEALRAAADGADYVALSPVFDTTSKDDAGSGKGLKMLSEIRKAVGNDFPVIAIGGINASNAKSVMDAGSDGCAVISAVLAKPDVTAAVRELRKIILS